MILGTTLLIKARIGLSWQQNNVYLTIGGENNKRLTEAHLNEIEKHTLVTVNEVELKPKETRRIEVQYETWRGEVTNFKNKPAFIGPNDEYDETNLHIEEINTTPQYSKMQINVTNVGEEGMQIPRNAQIAKLELLDSMLQKAQEQNTNTNQVTETPPENSTAPNRNYGRKGLRHVYVQNTEQIRNYGRLRK